MQAQTNSIETTPEEVLLLAVVRPKQGSAEKEEVQRLLARHSLDWDLVIKLAKIHRIRPQLYMALNGQPAGLVRASVLESLRAFYLSNLNRNMMLTQETLRISQLLKDKNISSIVFKGPLQAAMIYGNLALREMADIDTIIQPEDLSAAKAILLANGYFLDENYENQDDQVSVKDPNKYNISLWKHDRTVYLEMHWKVMPTHSWYGYREADLWNLTVTETMGGREILRFNREFVFILLCIHNEKHNWFGLRYLADVATMLRTHPDLNWELIVRLAKKFGKLDVVHVTCLICENLLGTEIPPLLRRKSRVLLARCAAMRAKMFYEELLVFPSFREWRFYRYGSPGGRGWFDRAYYLMSILWPEYRDKRRFLLVPPELAGLYVIPRLMRYVRCNWLPSKYSVPAQKE